MARSDLLVSLVKAGSTGDKRGFQAAAEAIIAEERAKRHDVLAERLSKAVQQNGNGMYSVSGMPEHGYRGREFIAEVEPRRRLDDIILPDAARRDVVELIEEQRRADVLRAHGLEPRSRPEN